LKIIAAGVGVYVQNFTSKIKSLNNFGLHSLTVNFIQGNSTSGNYRFVKTPMTDNIEGKVF